MSLFLSSFGMDPLIDPSLWDAQPNGGKTNSARPILTTQQHQTPCTCLSVMYLTISDLQTMSSFAFPAAIVPLRSAMSTAATLLQCERCPKDPFTAIQNVQSLTALLSALAERFHKILQEVDAEADRLEQTGTKKLFRISENNPATENLHTGDLSCPMGFNIELGGRDWQRFVKRAVKSEVLGGGTNPTPLTSLLDIMEQRQHQWHIDNASLAEHDLRVRMFGNQSVCTPRGNDATCLRMVGAVRNMVSNLKWE